MMECGVLDTPYGQLVDEHPLCEGFFDQVRIERPRNDQTMNELIAGLDEFELADCGMDAAMLQEGFERFLARMEALSGESSKHIRSLTICGGTDKDGRDERFELTAQVGEIICIVGPTGSGKSRLLEDIEYLAQGDTPTHRTMLIDGKVPDSRLRFAVEDRIVSQLSQSMVFVMDLSVRDFLNLHAESRMMDESIIPGVVEQTIECANELAGEPFAPELSLTMLSGGQSRALMIADLAFISTSPIVLVDEIENAGVDRKQALDLLINNDKIVFVVTHDPLIALMGDCRLVIANGGIRDVIRPSSQERANASDLYRIDETLMALRRRIRRGERIDFPIDALPEGGA